MSVVLDAFDGGAPARLGVRRPTARCPPSDSINRRARRVTINGYTYRSTVAPMLGPFMLPISAEVSDNAGVAAGDQVEVNSELDTEPGEVTVPADQGQYAGSRDHPILTGLVLLAGATSICRTRPRIGPPGAEWTVIACLWWYRGPS